jgi:polyisoprenoid-binding protein YceI
MNKINVTMKNLVWLVLLLLTAGNISAQVMFIDTEASEVEFEVKKFKLFEVEGTFTGMKGTIRFDTSNLEQSNFMVCIDAETVKTGIKKRDNHLRSEEFFDVENFPRICVGSKSIEKKGSGYIMTAALAIRNIEKEVVIPFTYKDKIFEGEFEINRKDYNVGKDFSTFTAGNEIEVEIKCVIK